MNESQGLGHPAHESVGRAPLESGPPVNEVVFHPANVLLPTKQVFYPRPRDDRPSRLGRRPIPPILRPEEPVVHPDRELADPAERTSGPREWVRAETTAALKSTFTALIKHALEAAAHAHGFGVLLKVMEGAWTAVKWQQVGEGDRGVDVMKPVLLASGVELDLSAQAGPSSGDAGPLVTGCFAPSSGPDPGILVIDGYQISPGDAVEENQADRDRKAARYAPERETGKVRMQLVDDEGRVALVRLDLSQLTSRERDPRVRAAALMYLARGQLLPTLKQRKIWDELQAAAGPGARSAHQRPTDHDQPERYPA